MQASSSPIATSRVEADDTTAAGSTEAIYSWGYEASEGEVLCSTVNLITVRLRAIPLYRDQHKTTE